MLIRAEHDETTVRRELHIARVSSSGDSQASNHRFRPGKGRARPAHHTEERRVAPSEHDARSVGAEGECVIGKVETRWEWAGYGRRKCPIERIDVGNGILAARHCRSEVWISRMPADIATVARRDARRERWASYAPTESRQSVKRSKLECWRDAHKNAVAGEEIFAVRRP